MSASVSHQDRSGGDWDAQRVLAALPRGKDASTPMETIADQLGGSWSYRTVKRCVQRLRLDGFPVAADARGVFLTDNPVDMTLTYRHIRSQIESQARTAWACRSTARRMAAAQVEQTTLFGEAA